MSIDKLKTKFFTGSFVADVKHYFSKINEIIDYLNGNGLVGSGSYKVYNALLNQVGTNAPTAIVLSNTLGAITYTRDSNGFYYIYSQGLFLETKTFIQGTIPDITIVRNDNDSLIINTIASGISSDDLLTNFPIEIRIYN